MFGYLMSALRTTIKSGFGLLGLAITGLGVVGHNLEATQVSPWVCVVGLGLFALAALWELAKADRLLGTTDTNLTKADDRAWHMEKERDRYRGLLAEAQNQLWAKYSSTSEGMLASSVTGDVQRSQSKLPLNDPRQGQLTDEPEDGES